MAHGLMRVLQIHSAYRTPAGEDAVVHAEAELLRGRGHTVTEYYVPNPVRAAGAALDMARAIHNRRRVSEIRDLIATRRPDVAHIHNLWFSLSQAVVAEIAASGVPVVMTLHNYRAGCLSRDLFRDGAVCTACVGRSPLPGVMHGCYRSSRLLSAFAAAELVYHRRAGTVRDNTDVFIAPTDFARSRLVELGLPEDRLITKPHFVHDPGPRSGPASGSEELLFVGRLSPGKGLESLLRAWEQFDASGRRSGLKLSIIGDGPLRSALREAAPSGVEFDGWQTPDEVRARMLAARGLVFPSEWFEPFGMVLVEALACGLPVLGTDVGGVADIVNPPPPLLAQAGNSKEIARALSTLVEDEVVSSESRRVRERYEALFTPECNGPLLEAIYERALA